MNAVLKTTTTDKPACPVATHGDYPGPQVNHVVTYILAAPIGDIAVVQVRIDKSHPRLPLEMAQDEVHSWLDAVGLDERDLKHFTFDRLVHRYARRWLRASALQRKPRELATRALHCANWITAFEPNAPYALLDLRRGKSGQFSSTPIALPFNVKPMTAWRRVKYFDMRGRIRFLECVTVTRPHGHRRGRHGRRAITTK